MPKHEPDSLAISFPKPTESDFPHLESRSPLLKNCTPNCKMLQTAISCQEEYLIGLNIILKHEFYSPTCANQGIHIIGFPALLLGK